MANNFFGYVRVSTKDQADNGASLLAQEELITNLFATKFRGADYESLRIFRDEGVSAYKNDLPDRPEGAIMMSKVEPGDIVMITRLDRAFRNVEDGRRTIDFLAKQGVRCIILDFNGHGEVDSSTAHGRFVLTLMLSVAELESGIKAERLKAVDDYNRKTRGWARTTKCGYKTILKDGKTVAVHDPVLLAECERVMLAWYRVGFDAALRLVSTVCKLESRAKGKKWRGISVGPDPSDKNDAMNRAWKKVFCSLANTGRLGKILAELDVPVSAVVDKDGTRTKSPAGVHQNINLCDEGKKHVGLLWEKQAGAVPVSNPRRTVSLGPVREGQPVAQFQLGQDSLSGVSASCVAGPSALGQQGLGQADGGAEQGADHSLNAAGH